MSTRINPDMVGLFKAGVESQIKDTVIRLIVDEQVALLRERLEAELKDRLEEVTFGAIEHIMDVSRMSEAVHVKLDLGGTDVRSKTLRDE